MMTIINILCIIIVAVIILLLGRLIYVFFSNRTAKDTATSETQETQSTKRVKGDWKW
jgi:hypothetical protein